MHFTTYLSNILEDWRGLYGELGAIIVSRTFLARLTEEQASLSAIHHGPSPASLTTFRQSPIYADNALIETLIRPGEDVDAQVIILPQADAQALSRILTTREQEDAPTLITPAEKAQSEELRDWFLRAYYGDPPSHA